MRMKRRSYYKDTDDRRWKSQMITDISVIILCLLICANLCFAQQEGVTVAGEKLSLDLKGVDIVELFKFLSIKTGLNIVPTKNVTGRVNLYLNNVTFEDALDVILVSFALASDRRGDIISIMTSQEYEALYGQSYHERRNVRQFKLSYASPAAVFNALSQLKSNIGKVIVDEASGTVIGVDTPEKLELMRQTIEEIDKTPAIEVFNLQYAKASDIEGQLSKTLTSGASDMAADSRTNKVVVTDLPDKMKKIKRIVRAFDTPPLQVLIEAEIVQLSLTDKYQKGIDWEGFFDNWNDLKFKGKFPISASLSSYQQISFGVLNRDDYNAVFQLIQTFGNTDILSKPRIAVVNNQEARILVGSREAYITQTLSQAQTTTTTAESIQYIDVGVKLNVTPTISDDGFVVMKIKPEVSSVRETLTTALGSKVPIVETSEAETTIKVKDGNMILIAGLMKEEARKDQQKVPGVSKLPLLGGLFKNKSEEKKKTELIVFLTPRIITGDAEKATTKKPLPVSTRKKIIDAALTAAEKSTTGKPAALSIKGEITPSQPSDITKKIKGLR